MKKIDLEKITKELEKQGFDSISYSKENAIVIFIGEYKSKAIFNEDIIKEGLLKFIGIEEEDIKFIMNMGKDEIENIKNLIRIKKLKKELEILENLIIT